MIRKLKKTGFTLTELMIVIAFIGLLATLVIPGFVRSRNRSRVTIMVNNLRQVNTAIDQWVLEKNKNSGDSVNTNEVVNYLDNQTFPPIPFKGVQYAFQPVGSTPQIVYQNVPTSLTEYVPEELKPAFQVP